MATYRDVIVLDEKRYRSPAWAYFEVRDEDNKLASCNLCHETYSYKASVTNLSKHLKNKHKMVIIKKEEGNENVIVHTTFKVAKNNRKSIESSHELVKEIWDYFNIKDADKKLAKCMECDEVVSFKYNEDDLEEHVLEAHSIEVKDANSGKENDDNIIKYEVVNEDTSEETVISVWEYFDRKNLNLEVAFCSLCNEAVSYKDSPDKMLEHLMLNHDISRTCEDVQDSGTDVEMSRPTYSSPPKERKHKSIAWEYFDVHDEQSRTARCRLCSSICSYNSSVTNLMKHIHRHMKRIGHTIKRSREDEALELPGELSKKPRESNQSRIWQHFKCVDSNRKLATCLACGERLSYRGAVSNLRRHLARRHPEIEPEAPDEELKPDSESDRILLATGDHIYELQTKDGDESSRDCSDQDNNVEELETVYIDEFVNQIKKDHRDSVDSTKAQTSKSMRNQLSRSVTLQRRNRDSGDSLDTFGPYIASLLRQLPRETSNRLQMEFVQRVMEAQAEADTSSATDRATNAFYNGVTIDPICDELTIDDS